MACNRRLDGRQTARRLRTHGQAAAPAPARPLTPATSRDAARAPAFLAPSAAWHTTTHRLRWHVTGARALAVGERRGERRRTSTRPGSAGAGGRCSLIRRQEVIERLQSCKARSGKRPPRRARPQPGPAGPPGAAWCPPKGLQVIPVRSCGTCGTPYGATRSRAHLLARVTAPLRAAGLHDRVACIVAKVCADCRSGRRVTSEAGEDGSGGARLDHRAPHADIHRPRLASWPRELSTRRVLD